MAQMPVKQVTVTMTVQTRARGQTIEGWVRKGLIKTMKEIDWDERGSYDIQQIVVEEALDGSNRQVRLGQLSTRMDIILGEIEEIGDNALQRLEERCRIVEEFTKPEGEGEAEG